jgi:hypothetical protein
MHRASGLDATILRFANCRSVKPWNSFSVRTPRPSHVKRVDHHLVTLGDGIFQW